MCARALQIGDDAACGTHQRHRIDSPRPPELIAEVTRLGRDDPALEPLYEAAVRDTVERFAATGSPVASL